jgi:peptidoglycan-associated lipoprotein
MYFFMKRIKGLVLLLGLVVVLSGCSQKARKSNRFANTSASNDSAEAEVLSVFERKIASVIQYDRVFFDFDSYKLSGESRAILVKTAEFLKENSDVSITIEGYCDLTGPLHYNEVLGQKRADVVANFLISEGVHSSKVRTYSFGRTAKLVEKQGAAQPYGNETAHLCQKDASNRAARIVFAAS